MGNTWGRKVPLKEVLRKNKREINKAVRELDRERANLEKQEQEAHAGAVQKKLDAEVEKLEKKQKPLLENVMKRIRRDRDEQLI